MQRTRFVLLNIILPLLTGSLIYFLFRTNHTLFLEWFNLPGLSVNVGNNVIENTVFSALVYNLPDALCLFALGSMLHLIWKEQLFQNVAIWITMLLLLACAHELLQLFNYFSGTFDPLDVLFYVGSYLVLLRREFRVRNMKFQSIFNHN
ncbi:MAG: hypothetical protein EP338_08245 [Bacteroidetes bacterium]|nr:MAG: hypothetical protein EP338_08245 [Bacteroidota bacterium]